MASLFVDPIGMKGKSKIYTMQYWCMQELEGIDEYLKEEAMVMAEVIALRDGREPLGKMYSLTNSELVM